MWQGLITRRFLLSAIVLAGGVLPALSLAAETTPASAASQTTTPTDAQLADQQCSVSEEQVLPGDYYYCLGAQTYGAGHYEQSQKFFATAASWSSKPAQYILGVMAFNGDHQPVNHPLGLAWLALAAERHRADFAATYQSAYASATAEDRRGAEALLQRMRPTYADETAARRAERRYRDGMKALTRIDNYAGVHCMSGVSTTNPGASDSPSNGSVACIQTSSLLPTIDKAASKVFEGWSGHVSVEPLQQIDTPPVSSTTGAK